jgi:hypothetical protein
MTSVRKARAELKKLKEAGKKPLPNGMVHFVNVDRGETRESVAARHDLEPDTEGLILIETNDLFEGLG